MSPIMALLSQAELQNLTVAGTVLMFGCVAFVLALCTFCFWRLTRTRQTAEHHHAPLDIDTRDTNG